MAGGSAQGMAGLGTLDTLGSRKTQYPSTRHASGYPSSYGGGMDQQVEMGGARQHMVPPSFVESLKEFSPALPGIGTGLLPPQPGGGGLLGDSPTDGDREPPPAINPIPGQPQGPGKGMPWGDLDPSLFPDDLLGGESGPRELPRGYRWDTTRGGWGADSRGHPVPIDPTNPMTPQLSQGMSGGWLRPGYYAPADAPMPNFNLPGIKDILEYHGNTQALEHYGEYQADRAWRQERYIEAGYKDESDFLSAVSEGRASFEDIPHRPRRDIHRPRRDMKLPDLLNPWGNPLSPEAWQTHKTTNDPRSQEWARDRSYMMSCFIDGVQVELADGSGKNVSEISVGDVVKTNEGEGSVVKVFHGQAGGQKLYGFNGKEPFVTEAHPFMTQRGWKKVSELEAGDTLYRNGLGNDTVKSIKSIDIPEDTPVYNFHVDTHENYFADGYLVHNKSLPMAVEGGGDPETMKRWNKKQEDASRFMKMYEEDPWSVDPLNPNNPFNSLSGPIPLDRWGGGGPTPLGRRGRQQLAVETPLIAYDPQMTDVRPVIPGLLGQQQGGGGILGGTGRLGSMPVDPFKGWSTDQWGGYYAPPVNLSPEERLPPKGFDTWDDYIDQTNVTRDFINPMYGGGPLIGSF